MDEVLQIVIHLLGYEIIINGEEMILDGLTDNHEHRIIIDGKHKMTQNGEVLQMILQLLIELEQQRLEDNDLVLLDIMFQVQKIGKICVIQFYLQHVRIEWDITLLYLQN